MTTKLGLFLGALLTLAIVGCDGSSSTTDSAGGSAGMGGSAGSGGMAGSGGTAGSAGMAGMGGTGGAAGPSVDAYCANMAKNCTGDNAQYGDDAACKAVAALFDAGTAADTSGATLGCREYHSGAAAMDGKTHCPHAGPLGAGACGEDCKNFCALAVAVCGKEAMPPYADAAACETACAMFPTTPAFNATVTSGDSLACRTYHLTVAATSADNAKIHCAHIAEKSDPCQ